MKEKDISDREFNPLEHKMVPKHEILSDEEVENLLSEYKIEKEQLPKIRALDPTVIATKAKIGDVIRITRDSKTAGKAYFYRMVIA